MKTSYKALLTLLERDPNKEENLSMYIRELRSGFRELLLQNTIYRQEATLPHICKISPYFRYNPVSDSHWFFQFCDSEDERHDYLFITLTFDPRKFPQLIVCPEEEQKQYIEQVLTIAHDTQKIGLFYGVYELQGNGNIHYHMITSLYDSKENKDSIKSFFTPFFTDRLENKYAVDVKQVYDMKGLINDYLLKAPKGLCHNLSPDQTQSLDL